MREGIVGYGRGDLGRWRGMVMSGRGVLIGEEGGKGVWVLRVVLVMGVGELTCCL